MLNQGAVGPLLPGNQELFPELKQAMATSEVHVIHISWNRIYIVRHGFRQAAVTELLGLLDDARRRSLASGSHYYIYLKSSF